MTIDGRSPNEWPNMIALRVGKSSVSSGDTLPLECVFQSYDNTSLISVYLSLGYKSLRRQQNSNLSVIGLGSAIRDPSWETRTIDVSGVIPQGLLSAGYHVFAAITTTTGGETRYLFAHDTVFVDSVTVAAPFNLTASATSSTSCSLKWTDGSNNETGFEIERRTASGTDVLAGAVGANVTSFSDTGLSSGTTYYYRVRAVRAPYLDSGYSGEVNATTLPSTANPTTQTLTVNSSNPASGIYVFVGPNAIDGTADGTTPFGRTYYSGTSITLVAPPMAGNNAFKQWLDDGVQIATAPTCSFTLSGSHVLTAVYASSSATFTGLTLSGSASVNQNTSATYNAIAHYSDGSTASVAALGRLAMPVLPPSHRLACSTRWP